MEDLNDALEQHTTQSDQFYVTNVSFLHAWNFRGKTQGFSVLPCELLPLCLASFQDKVEGQVRYQHADKKKYAGMLAKQQRRKPIAVLTNRTVFFQPL